MAKLAVTVAVVFLLLAVSPAHFQEVDLPEHDAAPTVETETALSENQKAIFLPSEDVGFAEIREVETDPDTHMISFHPNNRQFPRRPLLPFHHRHHINCRQRRQFRPWDPRFQKKDAIPFGDDMIRSDDGMNFDTVHPGGVRKVPAKWVRFHRRHERPRFIFSDEAMFRGPRHFHGDEENEREARDETMFRGPRHFHEEEENGREVRDEAMFRGPRHFHGDEENERKEHEHRHHHHEHHRHEEEEEQKGGFLKNFRKFLNQF